MQGSLDRPPIVIRSSRMTSALLLLICAGFAAFGIWMILKGPAKDQMVAYLTMAFFGLGIPLFAWRLIRPDELTLAPEGINWRSVLRTSAFRWDDVQDFRAYAPSSRTVSKHVGFDFTASYRAQRGPLSDATRQLTGVDGSFGGGWELGAAALADLLNDARSRWLRNRK